MYIHCYLISLLKYSADTSIIYIAGKGKDTGKGDRTMRICGLNKTTLLDYPGHVAAAVFLGGCNFRCPFCQNGDLVLRPESQAAVREEELFPFLEKRKGILSGVCITGGEPTMEKDLGLLAGRIKEMGYLVKLDTNGSRPEIIEGLLKNGWVDYIAMDIKNSMERYGETVGLRNLDPGRIRESMNLIMKSGIDYEFRTTIAKELHRKEDMESIGREIKGAKAYFLQSYQESPGVIMPGFHAYNRAEMERLAAAVRPFVPDVQVRG